MTQKKEVERMRHDRDHLQLQYEKAMNELVEKQKYIARLEGRINELEAQIKTISDNTDTDEWQGLV